MLTQAGKMFVESMEKHAENLDGTDPVEYARAWYEATHPYGVGWTEASLLSNKEQNKLRQHYALPQDTNLKLRGFGRELGYATLGGLSGLLASRALFKRNRTANMLASMAGAAVGGVYGSGKYSKDNPVLQEQDSTT